MIDLTGLKLPLSYTLDGLRGQAARLLKLSADQIAQLRVVKQSVDARDKGNVHFVLNLRVGLHRAADEAVAVRRAALPNVKLYQPRQVPPPVRLSRPPQVRPIVVGAGPAGLFAALTLARAGARPLLVERGMDVETRQRDVARFWATGVLDRQSNVQFGEGGAGAFSDGKLTTGIKNPHCPGILRELAACGAPEDILYSAKPHIGTDKLPTVVKGIRQKIEALGGEVRFGTQLTGLVLEGGALRAVRLSSREGEAEWPATALILALGHSARDTLALLYEMGVPMAQKPFSIGARIEHLQSRIDRAQYGAFAGHPALGAADYKLSCALPSGRTVYTFCMCPGGQVVAAASEEGGVATNGMSAYARDGINANSALLVGVGPGDFDGEHPLAGMEWQRKWERMAFAAGGGGYRAPAQRVEDFLARRPSKGPGEVAPSYRPGVTWAELDACLPPLAAQALRQALPLLGRRLKGFDAPGAALTGVETRSSSPVRILRGEDKQSSVKGLYPCGEGAGYAGGILSAAADGVGCALALLESIQAGP